MGRLCDMVNLERARRRSHNGEGHPDEDISDRLRTQGCTGLRSNSASRDFMMRKASSVGISCGQPGTRPRNDLDRCRIEQIESPVQDFGSLLS